MAEKMLAGHTCTKPGGHPGYPTEEFKNLKCESEENKAISEMGVVTEYNYHTSTHVSRV